MQEIDPRQLLQQLAGEVLDGVSGRIESVSLVERYGDERARAETVRCIEEVVAGFLSRG